VIKGFFGGGRKTTSGKLSVFKVVSETLTANSFSRTMGISAVAILKINFFLAFHEKDKKKDLL